MKLLVILFLYVFLLLQVDMKYILTDFMFRKKRLKNVSEN